MNKEGLYDKLRNYYSVIIKTADKSHGDNVTQRWKKLAKLPIYRLIP